MPIDMPRGLPFSVDTWNPNSKLKRHHFLTHAHKDHCSGITTHSSPPVYSTHLTKSIILCYFPQLDESLFVGIEVGQSLTIDDPDGSFSVTAYDANHCPGAVMFLFEGDFGNILHTGDCRLTPECLQNLPEKYISRKGKKPSCQLDFVFLDCTFGKSLMKIPSKQSALQQVTNCIWKHPDTPTIYLTCNMLGQEEVLVEVSKTFGSKIYVDEGKHPDFYQVLKLIAPQIISEDPSSRFHLFEGFPKLYEKAKKLISEARENMQPEPLIIRPSAQWYAHEETELTVTERRILERSNLPVKDQFGVWHVCYSMHSSKQELEWALELLAPKWVVSTTPECRAMELAYVKKHCFTPQASNDRFWKVLDMTVETSDVLVESSVFTSAEVNEVTNAASQELPKTLINQESVLALTPPRKKPSITLFGRARLGYNSCLEEKRILNIDGKSSLSECLSNSEKAPFRDLCTTACVEGEVNYEEVVEQKLQSSESKENIITEKANENDMEAVDRDTKTDYNMLRKDVPVCVEGEVKYEEVAEQKLQSSDNKESIITEKANENDMEAVDRDTATESNVLKKDVTVCKPVSHFYTGLLKGYSDNFQKLYRSMNVPVPQRLPSLAKLMESRKRAKRE